jgi:Zn-dependent peptidase ImmA (M78 family)
MKYDVDKIKRRFNIEIIDVQERPNYYNEVGMEERDFVNKSYIIGNDTVILGIYDNDEQKIASLFHEIGHTLLDRNYENQFNYEAEAWRIGIELAIEYGISFSHETMLWINKQTNTYISSLD